MIRGGNGKSVALVDALKELEELPAPADLNANIFAQLKSARARQLNTHSESRRDFSPAEDASVGAVQEPPAEWAGRDLPLQDVLKELEEPARAGMEGQRISSTSSALRFVSNPPRGR